jgi:hypothetical protein
MSTSPPTQPFDRLKLALQLRDRLNAGENPRLALTALGLALDYDVLGEDLGTESLSIDDPDNDVIDLGWALPQFAASAPAPASHYQVRRTGSNAPWVVEVMQRFMQHFEP